MPSPEETLFLYILCLIFKRLGRECAFLNKSPNLAAKQVKLAYEEERPLTLTNEEKQAFLDELTQLENILKSPTSPLDPEGTEATTDFIALARQDLAS